MKALSCIEVKVCYCSDLLKTITDPDMFLLIPDK